ncbi:MAG: DNA methyltransferase [Candidatus Zambryskibacteria bacterium RIFOXYD1_FULL_40_13]|nr:MAG: Modification methylase EcoRI [Parcubacteria group bacterium GW2011_GWC1_39_12]KKR19288.1 MAG: Modification methylase EcoRI [Parcubacteria group bacterium GW2011_GWF1_39_37]KKR35329.1 MAG: Modification methylase EcoRI [Parcubacteria group bacterium GW2011_GWC2_40_10]KKR52239.1 MAG: Modification methylase EcoRI [Parcubacteria group bacterium GW2011_GWE1_40_20]KKR65736.1 MAG: Modification methylase EcoRI [Parcubacteria group bacterium GW2011_GWB1_40_5]KKR69281.1 MAG: Modification methylas
MANQNLTNAKKAKNDEFYTQFPDIQKEVESYLEYDPNAFKGKVVYSNCDDPFESNFFRYFVLNFKRLGLKRLIATSYKPSPVANTQLALFGDDVTLRPVKGRPKIVANKFIINEVGDVDGDGSFTLEDIAKQLRTNKNNEWTPLEGDGDFRSDECVELLKQSDIIVTNPPFSLFREYIMQLFEYSKQFLIIGNMGSVLYKEIFPFVRDNKIWLGNGFHAGNAYFATPNTRDYATGVYDQKTGLVKFRNCIWVTNIDHGKRHQPIALMTMAENLKFNRKMQGKIVYDHYDNYDAIEIPFTNAIPSNYDGIMGVPVSFLDKYSPEQFEIMGMCENEDLYKLKTKFYTSAECKQAYLDKFGKKGVYDLNASGVLIRNGLREKVYQRILIKHKKK